MKEILSSGEKTAKERLDELFSRKTLGAVLFGAAVSKVVEKINILAVSAIIIFVLGIDISQIMWIAAGLLLVWWGTELLIFIYLYIKWEQTMEKAAEKAEQVTESASEAKEKVKKETSDYEVNIGAFGRDISCKIKVGSKK